MIKHRSLPTGVFLFLINGIVLCTGFLLLLQQNITVLKNTARDQTENNLHTFAYALEPLIQEHKDSVDAFVKSIAGQNPNFRITVINSTGKVIGDSDAADITVLENHGSRTEVKAALSGHDGKSMRRSTVNEKDVMYYAVPLSIDGNNYALRLSMPVDTSVFFSTDVRKNMIIFCSVVLVVIMLVSFLVSAHIVHQIGDLQKATDKYKNGDFDYFPAVNSPRELQELSESVSSMAQEIKSNIADITQKRDEFEAVFSGTTEGLIVFDSGMKVLECNDAAAAMFGSTATVRRIMTLTELVCNVDIISLAQKAIRINSPVVDSTDGVETGVRSINGELMLQVHCVSIGSPSDRNYFLLILNDITRVKKLEQVRKDFVANVSHELKTPVTSIKGFTETLLDGAIDDKDTAHRFLEIIEAQSSRLMNIIEDLLTLSHLEQESKLPDMIRTDIVEATREVYSSFLHAAGDKNIVFSFVGPEMEVPVLLNVGLYEQAVGNIIDNAVKYCPEHTQIECSVFLVDNMSAQVVVQDTGMGISPQYRERIFERFFRVDKGRSRENGGTGLGLSITAHIIQIHGGSVRETGRTDGRSGARFVITLPVIRT
jgi:two-component system, OmpR family, phosphate regulon sensor histidine kinase PhoR